MRRTKIIATIGPSSDKPEIISEMDAFVDMYRINSSHNSIEECMEKLDAIRSVSEKPVFVDLRGPKIRTRRFDEEFVLKDGDVVDYEEIGVFVDGKDIRGMIEDGSKVLIDDGRIEAVYSDGKFRIVKGGVLLGSKGIFIPGMEWDIDNPTETDMEYVKALKGLVDGFAISFVNSSKDVMRLREFFDGIIISKIETLSGVDRISEISDASDVVMIARGDLGVEVGIENLPIIQDTLVKRIRHSRKPFIVATQVAQSMVSERIPTRAEVSDIYLSVLQGADMIMFSNETAVGSDPVNTVRTARGIVDNLQIKPNYIPPENGLTYSLARHSVELAEAINADALLVLTKSGLTAESISLFKPSLPVYAFSTDKQVVRKMHMYYGVVPKKINNPDDIYGFFEKSGLNTVVFVAGSGFNIEKTDTIQVLRK